MNSVILPARAELIEQTANQLEADGKDYSSQLVVFPGKRPSHFLRKFLARKEKSSFIPPKIFSMDEFVDFVYEQLLGNKNKKLEILDAVAILYRIHTQDSVRLGGDNFSKPDLFFSLGLKLYRNLEEFYIEKITPTMVEKIDHLLEESIPPQTLGKLQLLSRFYQAFYQTLESNNYSSRSLRYVSVAKADIHQHLARFKKIIFTGFFALTKAEQEIFSKLLAGDKTLFISQDGPGLKENLNSIGFPDARCVF